jgi:hypothetical protein
MVPPIRESIPADNIGRSGSHGPNASYLSEVAKLTGISEANVKTRLSRARGMLRDQLKGI